MNICNADNSTSLPWPYLSVNEERNFLEQIFNNMHSEYVWENAYNQYHVQIYVHAVTLVNLITTQGVKMMYDMNMFCFCYQR